jgi:alkylhydroperoxidase family enzyme
VAYIRYVEAPDYDAEFAGSRGILPNILRIHGIEPGIGRAHQALYRAILFGPSPVTRLEREAIAVTVSAANSCHY